MVIVMSVLGFILSWMPLKTDEGSVNWRWMKDLVSKACYGWLLQGSRGHSILQVH